MQVRDRVKELRRVRADTLIPNARNWRRHPQAQADALRGALAEIGYADALLVRETPDGLQLIDGHLRAETTPDMEVPVLVLDVDEAEADKLLATLDPLAAMAVPDAAALEALLAEVTVSSEALQAMLDDLAKSANIGPAPGLTDPDAVPEPPEPISKTGDLWLCGDHWLLCGDSTKVEDVERLMAGEKADCVFADAPYGMKLNPDYDAMHSSPDHRKTGKRFEPVKGDDAPFDPRPVMALAQGATEQFWWGADYYRSTLPTGGSWTVWDKRTNENGINLDAVIGGAFELCWSQKAHRREIARILWSGHHGMQGEDAKTRLHPTQKPTALVEFFLERWVTSGAVYDPFLGSGTTMIACERLGRRCFGMEIAPNYVDVAVKRWEQFTGREAQRG